LVRVGERGKRFRINFTGTLLRFVFCPNQHHAELTQAMVPNDVNGSSWPACAHLPNTGEKVLVLVKRALKAFEQQEKPA
jgi:hypothetical protein